LRAITASHDPMCEKFWTGHHPRFSSLLSRTTYFFTEISFTAMIASVTHVRQKQSRNIFKLVEAGD
jgi:hypothetical protein